MLHLTAHRHAAHLPLSLAVLAGTALECAHRELFPRACFLRRERDVRRQLSEMDLETCVLIAAEELARTRES